MSNTSPENFPPPLPAVKKRSRFQDMARASWIAPLIAFGLNFFLMTGLPDKNGEPNIVRMIIGPLFIIAGLIFGVVALFGIPKYGTSGILGPAVAGIGINVLLIVMALVPLLYLKAHRAHLQPAVHSPTAFRLTNDTLHFSIDIPEGFKDQAASPSADYAYIKDDLGGPPFTVIIIERMGGKLIPKNQRLKREQMPPGFTGQVTTRNWRGLQVDTLVATQEANGFKMVVYTMQIPLKPAAIQLNVGGPDSKRKELAQLADTLLASLEGETNW